MELVKGSLNTFLNAMTYPDKTIYPIASCNDKDFQNLMHVYLDAVFYPRIYDTDKIFCQEGWHYELNAPEGELTINGVVYYCNSDTRSLPLWPHRSPDTPAPPCAAPGKAPAAEAHCLCPVGQKRTDIFHPESMGKDIYSEYDNGIRQPFFSVTASDTDTGKEREFVELIDGELRRIAREGFDQKTLLAGINHYEFRYREADFGRFPKGLMYGIQVSAPGSYPPCALQAQP